MRIAMPWLEDVDIPAARTWAQYDVLADQCYAWLRAGSIVNTATGEGKRLLDDYRKLRQAQLAYARELGMTPAARAAIKAGSRGAPIDIEIDPETAERAIAAAATQGQPIIYEDEGEPDK